MARGKAGAKRKVDVESGDKLSSCWQRFRLHLGACKLHATTNKPACNDKCRPRVEPICFRRVNCKDNPYCIHRLGLEKWPKELAASTRALRDGSTSQRRDLARQPCGLVNSGNTCYVNSFLQLWFNDLVFRKCIFDWRADPDFAKPSETKMDVQEVLNCLQRLFITMQITPFEDTSAELLTKALGLDNEQHDAQEFTTLFFDALDRHLSIHPNGASVRRVIQTRFEGVLAQTLRCECGRRSSSQTVMHSLQLSVEDMKSVQDALDRYFELETLHDFRCEVCGQLGRARRQLRIERLPSVLIIQLNRYVFDHNGRKKKLTHAIQYPPYLDLASYCDDCASPGGYSLSAVMVHEGTDADSGHYFDVIRDPVSLRWFKYNDEVVEETKAPGAALGKETKKTSADLKGCYCLVYRKPETVTGAPDLPESIACNLRESMENAFQMQTHEDSETQARKYEKMHAAHEELKNLWDLLEVKESEEDKASEIVFLPTSLLSQIQKKELECALSSDLSSVAIIEPVSLQLCTHNHLPLRAVLDGRVKAVQRSGMQTLLSRYRIHVDRCISGEDICAQCVDLARGDAEFTRQLETLLPLIKSVLKDRDTRSFTNGMLVSELDLKHFKRIALRQRQCEMNREAVHDPVIQFLSSQKKEDEDDNRDATRPTNGDCVGAKRVKLTRDDDEGDDEDGEEESEQFARDENSNEHVGIEEDVENKDDDEDVVPEWRTFNADLRCRHGGLKPEAMAKRVLVREEDWQQMTQFFADCHAVSSTTPVCIDCQAELQRDAACASDRLRRLNEMHGALLALVRRTMDAARSRPTSSSLVEGDFVVCRKYLQMLKSCIKANGVRSEGNIAALSSICQGCLLCASHARPVIPLSSNEEITDAVRISEEEWMLLVQLTDCKEVIRLACDGSYMNAFCNECFALRMRDEAEKRFVYEEGAAIRVQLKGDEASAPESGIEMNAVNARALRRNRNTNGLMQFNLRSSQKVAELKAKIYEKIQESPHDQLLFVSAHKDPLDDSCTLQEARVARDETVILIVQRRVEIAKNDECRQLERGFRDTALAH